MNETRIQVAEGKLKGVVVIMLDTLLFAEYHMPNLRRRTQI